jgi:tellurite resistance protein TerC
VQDIPGLLFIFGAFLIATGVKMLSGPEARRTSLQNPVVRFMKSTCGSRHSCHDQKFFVRELDRKTAAGSHRHAAVPGAGGDQHCRP